MTALALVEHFLDEEGQRQFPSSLQRVADEASRYAGYISVRRLQTPDDPSACLFLVEFADPAAMQRWIESPERAQIMVGQQPNRLRPLQSRRFLADPPFVPAPR